MACIIACPRTLLKIAVRFQQQQIPRRNHAWAGEYSISLLSTSRAELFRFWKKLQMDESDHYQCGGGHELVFVLV